MPEMDWWDWILLAAAGYLAVVTLVGLMRHRRDAILSELSSQAERESRRQAIERKRAERPASPQRAGRKAS